MDDNDSIAIVGIGCRFPGNIGGPEEFWEALLNKQDGITTVPQDRWRADIYTDRDRNKAGKIVSDKGGFIQDINKFDAEFFNIPPDQAAKIDPQQRLLLETTYEAFEDAGITLDKISETRTSVIVGTFMHDYLLMQNAASMRDYFSPHTLLGTHISMIANRISYFYNLNGPSYTIDTACSSSLAAVHLAIQSILNDNCETAIAAGVNIMIQPEIFMVLSQGGFLSEDGRCKSFDETANGYVRGEGVGVVILKRLSRALQDGNKIYTVIRSSGVNQSGFNSEGSAIPSKTAQFDLIRHVYNAIHFDPTQITYIEAHGTGTVVGDPIEVSALGDVIGVNRKDTNNICYLGSVKSNIGHTEGSAGIAGLIKAALVSKHRKIPANLHLNRLNPKLQLEKYCFKVPTELVDLTDYDKKIYIAVNSFGAGGTNVHVLLEEYIDNKIDKPTEDGRSSRNWLPFIITARSQNALEHLAHHYYEFVKKSSENSVSDICYSLLTKRTMFSHQLIIVAHSKEQLIQNMSDFCEKKQNHEVLSRMHSSQTTKEHGKGKVAFVFSGQGSQWVNMGKGLIETFPIFRDTLMDIDAILTPMSGWSILDELLNKNGENSNVDDTITVPILTTAIQIGLTKLWTWFGIKADGVIGHSVGEVAAQYAAGALTIEQVVYFIWHRSRLLSSLKGRGKMLAIGLDEQKTRDIANKYHICVAAFNGPKLSVLSGAEHTLKEIASMLGDSEIFNRFVKSDVPFHSKYVESIKDDILNVFKNVKGRKVEIPLYSTVTAQREAGEHISAAYYYRNIRETVLFTETINVMIADGYTKFIEIGPHPLLIAGIKELLNQHNISGEVYHSTLRDRPESCELLLNLGKYIASKGVYNLSPSFINGDIGCSDAELPRYVWQHNTSYWHEPKYIMEQRIGKYVHPFLQKQIKLASNPNQIIWEINFTTKKYPYLADHVIDGTIVLPATAYIEFAYAIAKEQTAIHPQQQIVLKNVAFERAIIIPDVPKKVAQLRFETISDDGDFAIYARNIDIDNYNDQHVTWMRHASGQLTHLESAYNSKAMHLFQLQEEFKLGNSVKSQLIYEKLRLFGLDYGIRFQGIDNLWYQDGRILAEVSLMSGTEYEIPSYYLHPALFDICLHCVFSETVLNGNYEIYLPHTVDEVIIIKKINKNKLWVYTEIKEHSKDVLICDTCIFEDGGEIVVEMKNVVLKNLSPKEEHYNYEYIWVEQLNSALSISEYDLQSAILFCGNGFETFVESLTEIAKRTNNLKICRFNIPENREVYNLTQLLSTFVLDKRTHLIYLPSNKFNSTSVTNYYESVESEAIFFLEIIKTIIKLNGTPRVYVIGDNAVNLETNLGGEVNHSLLIGIGRGLRTEHPEIPFKLIQLSEIAPSLEQSVGTNMCNKFTKRVYDELLKWNFSVQETEIKLEGEKRYVRKLHPVGTHDTIEKFLLKPKRSYIITGGTSGVGLKLVQWMCERGASDIVLISRSGYKSKTDQQFIEKIINSYEVNIYVEKFDITDIESMKTVFNKFGNAWPPLAGIIHSAGVIDGSRIENMSANLMHKVISVKMRGALILHVLTLNVPLDFFLMMSSIAAVIGSAGVTNYAAANQSLDSLAKLRQHLHLPGTSLNLGLLGEYAGMSKRDVNQIEIYDKFESVGYLRMPFYQLSDSIDLALIKQVVNQVVAKMNWVTVRKGYPHMHADARFADMFNHEKILVSERQQSTDDIWQKFSNADYDRTTIISNILVVLKSIFHELLSISPEHLDVNQPISTLGLDSIYLMQIQRYISRKFNITYSIMKLTNGPNLNNLSEDLFKEISEAVGFNNTSQTEQNKPRDYDFIVINEWLVAKKRNEDAKFRLVCFHSMGASASLFSKFLHTAPRNIEMSALQLPGRENRIEETIVEDFSALIKIVAKDLHLYLAEKPFIFWGHSFGGIIAFQLLSYLQSEYNLKPRHFIISGTIPPSMLNVWKTRDIFNIDINENNLEAILSILRFNDPIVVKEILPAISLDMPLMRSYHDYGLAKLPCGITAFAAKQDDVVYSDEVEQWKLFTNNSFECILIEGDHWFLNRNYTVIQTKLDELAAKEFT